jgi:hypothetical protein
MRKRPINKYIVLIVVLNTRNRSINKNKDYLIEVEYS